MAEALDRLPRLILARDAERRDARRWVLWTLALVLLAVGSFEVRTATLQSLLFSGLATRARFEVGPGPSSSVHFPQSGPYDHAHGYRRIPEIAARLEARGWRIESQARWTPGLRALHALGLPAPIREENRPGLRIRDAAGVPLFDARGGAGYTSFGDVPPLVVATLLFLEDRHLLDSEPAQRNPSVDWPRLMHALGRYPLAGRGPGGSTLATQLEKLRHSPGGVTRSPADKLRQMLAASLRAYRNGRDTSDARELLVLDYLNALPLGGAPGVGAVSGLDSGLRVWFDADPDRVDALLRAASGPEPVDVEAGRAYRRVVALLLATRKPSIALRRERDGLEEATDAYLRLLEAEGVAPVALVRAALAERLDFASRTPVVEDRLVQRKPAQPVRAGLVSLLGLDDYPELDALDLEVGTSLDSDAQRRAQELLRELASADGARRAGLVGHRLLDPDDDPAAVVWSFALYERGEDAHRVRVQVDGTDSPLDVHDGVRLDLGSTAKLRTLLFYLSLVADLQADLAGRTPEALRARAAEAEAARDPLTAWTAETLAEAPGLPLEQLLERALDRRYSASPHEWFFTGGGRHRFANFDPDDDWRRPSVREAFRDSLNLPFVRLMRDVVAHLIAREPLASGPEGAAQRDAYLMRFADYEGSVYLRRFFERYRGVPAEKLLDALLEGRKKSPRQLAAILEGVEPELSSEAFEAELRQRTATTLSSPALARLRAAYASRRFGLVDRAYLAGLHPLELWLVARRFSHGEERFEALREASFSARVASYQWLFRSDRRAAQDRRIGILREQDAFEHVLHFWQRLGYPFSTVTPSLATAIGSAGDRPSSIADLLGVLQHGGLRAPTRRIEQLAFAPGTPFETRIAPASAAPERVLRQEVVAAAREVLYDVVEHGTGRRALGALVAADGTPLAVGGKTGTGDHRHKTFAPGGRLVEQRFVSRAAAFAFLIGDRHYGVVTAHVTGPEAGRYHFTSALAVQGFRVLAPVIEAVVAPPPAPEVEVVAARTPST